MSASTFITCPHSHYTDCWDLGNISVFWSRFLGGICVFKWGRLYILFAFLCLKLFIHSYTFYIYIYNLLSGLVCGVFLVFLYTLFYF